MGCADGVGCVCGGGVGEGCAEGVWRVCGGFAEGVVRMCGGCPEVMVSRGDGVCVKGDLWVSMDMYGGCVKDYWRAGGAQPF